MTEILRFSLHFMEVIKKEIGNYKVDVFCQELNTVFEFYWYYWHAHPDLFADENAEHPTGSMMTKIKLLLP